MPDDARTSRGPYFTSNIALQLERRIAAVDAASRERDAKLRSELTAEVVRLVIEGLLESLRKAQG